MVLRFHLLSDVRVLSDCQSIDVHSVGIINVSILLPQHQPRSISHLRVFPQVAFGDRLDLLDELESSRYVILPVFGELH